VVKALFDTNILIDYLRGLPQAEKELGAFEGRAISMITWMEVMIGAPENATAATERFLAGFEVIGVDDAVARRAVQIRKRSRVKLPDAIVWASAETRNLLLVTRNSMDFPSGDPGIRVPYRI
jgi:predicted nucleic acid-binding protein